MRGALVDQVENELLDLINGIKTLPSFVAPLKAALFTQAPGETIPGVEVDGRGYTRQAITFGGTAGGRAQNATGVRFGDLPAADIVAIGVFDSADRLMWRYVLPAPRRVEEGDGFRIPPAVIALEFRDASAVGDTPGALIPEFLVTL